MGHDIIDHFQGVKDVNLCSASPGRQESTPNFSTLLLSKKKLVITLTTYSRKKKGLNTYLRPVSLSNSIWYAKNCRAIRPNNKLSNRINVLRIILIRIPLVLPITSM